MLPEFDGGDDDEFSITKTPKSGAGESPSSGSEGISEGTRPKNVSLLDKIKQTLAATSAERWEQAGEELDTGRKFQKPQDTWEQLYCCDVKSGVLVLRKSLPVRANYFGGGYTLSEAGLPHYLVEVRARGWAPKMIIDPYYRAAPGAEKNYEVLVEGDIAKQLYQEIDFSVKEFRNSLKRDFTDMVSRVMASVQEKVHETSAEEWETLPGDKFAVLYRGELGGLSVEVGRTIRGNAINFHLTLSKYGLKWDCKDTTLMRDVFLIVDDSVKQRSLEQLGKVLDDIF